MISFNDFLLAFFGGLITFIRPCIYLVLITFFSFAIGVAFNAKARKETGHSVLKAFVPMYLGLTIIFILNAFPGETMQFFMDKRPVTTKVSAVIMILFGLHFMGLLKRPNFISEKTARLLSIVSFFALGSSMGVAWTHCLTPILGEILTPISVNPTLIFGTLALLIIYSLALAVPFSISSVLIEKVISAIKFREESALQVVNGSFFILLGAALFTNSIWIKFTQILIKASSGSISNQLEVLVIQLLKR